MNRYISRSLIALLAVASLTFGSTALAQSVTGPWQWTDLSDKLTASKNRPVWSVVRAEPYWYMTDGQELWSGGHVWKTDGSSVTDITVDVRNAGLSRVDDMVSDGQTVLFLKNVTLRNNSIEAIAYNGSYANLTTKIRQNLSSDESLVQITGQNAVWGMITTYGRVILINQTKNETRTVQLANYKLTNAPYIRSQVSPTGATLVFAIQPAQGKWLAMWEEANGTEHFVKIDEYGNATALTSPSNPDDSIVTMASNGQNVLVGGYRSLGTNSTFAHVYDGTSFRNVTQYPMPNYWFGSVVGYNGKSWMIVQGKNLLRFDGTNFQTYGQTADKFVSLAGNGNGTFLLGGAVSTINNSDPTSPLTAKLVRVDEGTGYVAPTTGTTGSSNTVSSDEKLTTAAGKKNNITYRAFFTPDWAWQDNVSDPKYTVVGQSYDGLTRIELYINGIRQKVCDGKNSKSNVTCVMFIESTGYAYDADVAVNAKLTSAKGLVAWVPMRYIQFHNGTVDHSTTQTTQTVDGQVTANMTVSNWAHTLTRGTTVTVTANASAPAGLSRMDLYVNGSVKNTCSVSGTYNTCNFTLGTDYPNGSAISFNVRAVDVNGRDGWTWLGTYNITDQYVAPYQTGDVMANLFVDSWSGSGNSASAYVKTTGSSPNGLNRLDLYANGSLYRTCTYNQAYGTQTCAVSVWASSFPYTTTVPIYVLATDANGHRATSNTVNLNFSNNTSNGSYNNNYNGSLSVWFGAEVANGQTLRRDLTQTINVYGQSSNGLNKLEIYANDNLVQQCNFSNIYNSTQTCQTTIYGSSYGEGSSVYLKARATDANGNVAWTSGMLYLNITGNGAGTGNSTVYFTVSPNDNNWNRNTNRYITAYGYDSDGLRRLEIFMRGVNYKSCEFSDAYNTQLCSLTVNGTDNTAGSNVEINVRATDKYGNVTWASSKYFLMTNDGANQNGTVYLTVSPDKTTYPRTDTVQLYASATDNDTIKRIDIYANGSIVNTCTASSWNTSYSCSANVYLNNYSAGTTQLPVQAKVTDIYENVVWSSTKYLTVTDSSTYNTPSTITLSLSADKASYASNETFTLTANATDPDGLGTITLYANGTAVNTQPCVSSGTTGYCSAPVVIANYANGGSTLNLQAKTVDSQNNVTWSSIRSVTITGTQQTTDRPGSVTISTDASSGYTTTQNVTFTANGSDPNGIERIEILVNAQLAKTCYGATTCSFTGGPYSTDSVSYGTNLYDQLGNRTWSGYKSINKR